VIREWNAARRIAAIFGECAEPGWTQWNWFPAVLFLLFCSATGLLLAPELPAGDNWQPISPADLALKDNPANPGDHAMILYRQESLDDVAATISEYKRIKIFDDQGKGFGNLTIEYYAGTTLNNVRARTILPDGTIVNFSGKAHDLVVTKSDTERVLARTLALPSVQPGCIVEYSYTIQRNPYYYYGATWEVQDDLFTRDAIFTIRPYPGRSFYTRVSQLPEEARPVRQKDDTYRMELQNIAALLHEELMPPEDMLRGRIEFFYRSSNMLGTDKFWKETGKKWNDDLDKFADGHKDEIQHEVTGVIAAGDTDQVKLQKLYDRAQKIRNLGYEPEKTEQEKEREKLKVNNNAGDVLKNGYATTREVNFFFVALARAAGFNATEVYVSPRNHQFFNPEAQETRQLTADVVDVRLVSGDLYLDPACAGCPYGLLPWYETKAPGLRPDHDGGEMVSTSAPKPEDAVMARHADLQITSDGLQGTLTVDYTGIWAIEMRDSAWHQDETGREKMFTDDISNGLPPGSHFKLTSMSGWDHSSGTIRVQGDVEIAGALVPAGHRLLLTTAVLHAGQPAILQPSERTYPIYYQFPFKLHDEVVLHIPPEFRVNSLPNSVRMPAGAANYELGVHPESNGILLTRDLSVSDFLFSVKAYPALRSFYAKAHQDDEQQIVLLASAKP
jgi:hypothetical protein